MKQTNKHYIHYLYVCEHVVQSTPTTIQKKLFRIAMMVILQKSGDALHDYVSL